MATLGEKLKLAREKKGVTASQAAAATRIKVQHIEALEANHFQRIPAPAYVKGFIRMYADYLAIPSGPLVKEYIESFMPRPAGTAPAEPPPSVEAPRRPAAKPVDELTEDLPVAPRFNAGKLVDALAGSLARLSAAAAPLLRRLPWKIILPVGLTILVVIYVVRHVIASPAPSAKVEVIQAPARARIPSGVPVVAQEPPETYLAPRVSGGNAP